MADSMHVARKLATINVSPGAGTLQTALDNANAGDTLVLADGTYTGSGSDVLTISKDITIRAQNAGQAILDGENTRRVIKINSGTVVLEGLKITKGSKVRPGFERYPFHGQLSGWSPSVLSLTFHPSGPDELPFSACLFLALLCLFAVCEYPSHALPVPSSMAPVELTVSLVSRVHDSSTSIDLQIVRVLAPRMSLPCFNAPLQLTTPLVSLAI